MIRVDTIEGAAWQARNLTLTYVSLSDLRLDVATVEWAGRTAIKDLRIRCFVRSAAMLSCDQGSFLATIPAWGQLQGSVQVNFDNSERWHAEIEVPRRGLVVAMKQAATHLQISARLRGQAAEDLRKLGAGFGLTMPGVFAGNADLTLIAELSPATSVATLEVSTGGLNYTEPSGRYAAEKLAVQGIARWHGVSQRWELELDADGGQLYAEPLFFDFSTLPVKAEVAVLAEKDHWRIKRLYLQQGLAGTLEATGLIARNGFKPESAEISFQATDLAPLVATDLQPFLIGTRLDGLLARGGARGTISLRNGSPTVVTVEASRVALSVGKLGLSLQGLSGQLHWADGVDANPAVSSLQWGEGAMARIPLGPASVSFRARGRDFELLAPWRQPLLEGALRVERLALRGLGAPQLDADFRGTLEPINLAALCKALDWPVFGGSLGGQLPGLRVRNDVWSMEGALEAQVFDGAIRLENLQAIEPLGVLPRVTADLHMRRLDLEALTGTFSFGRITGRLDGDIESLRLLGWKPVAFDGRLFSSPGKDRGRRISQRAIDSISAIGGGPTGLLSRGFLSIFKEFSYDRIGIGCVLRDGVCRMDGIEAVRSKEGRDGYYLVKGRLLPRIDVVGYTGSVSWDTLVEQIKAAHASDGPRTK